MNWLDKYIQKNETGYLINKNGGIFVSVDEEFVRPVKGDDDVWDLEEISKYDFLHILLND